MPGQATSGRPRLLPPHPRRSGLRWRHPRAPLSVPLLPAHRVSIAAIRLAFPTLQHSRDLSVSHRPSVARLHSQRLCPSRRAARYALPAWPTLEPPFPPPRRELVRGPGSVDRAPCRSQLRDAGLAHAPNHWLDIRSSLPVFRIARAPVGLAPVSRSRRPARHAPARFSVHLRLPTQHLHSLQPARASIVLFREIPHGCQSRKTQPVSLRRDCAVSARSPAAWGTHT